MSSAVGISTVERIPDFAKFEKKISHRGVVKERYTSRFFPTGASLFSSSGVKTINFNISSNDYMDPATVTLNFVAGIRDGYNLDPLAPVAAANADKGAAAFEDTIAGAIIRKITLRCAGVTIEEIEDYGILNNMLTYATCPQQFYDNQLNAAEGSYLLRPALRSESCLSMRMEFQS